MTEPTEKKDEEKEKKDEEKPEVDTPLPVWLQPSVSGLFKNSFLSDVTLVLGSGEKVQKVPAHRFILASASPLLECMLYPRDDKGESVLSLSKAPFEVKLPNVDPDNFLTLLKCIYTDEVEISASNIQSLLKLASKYQVEKLKAACSDFMEGDVNAENVLDLWLIAPSMMGDENFGMSFIEEHTEDVLESDAWTKLPKDYVLKIVQSERLTADEITLFKAIQKWGKAQLKDEKDDLKEKVKDIIPHIRFPLMELPDIAAIVNPSGLLPETDLLQLFSYISVADEKIRSALPPLPYSTEPRSGGKRCKFASINDTNGLLYLIGTNGGKSGFTNPILSGAVTARLSTTGSSSVDHIADRLTTSYSVENSYGSETNPWLTVQFNNYILKPTEIVICQDQDHYLRNWKFEGREKGKTDWQLIQEYKDDRTIEKAVPHQACFKVKSAKFFQEFRIYLTGASHKGQNNFDITQLEFYGYYKQSK